MKLSATERQNLLLALFSEYMLGKYTQGELLTKLRKEVLGVNQEIYAKRVGVSRRKLSDIENDIGNVSQATIDLVFRPLGMRSGVQLFKASLAQDILKDAVLISDKNSSK